MHAIRSRFPAIALLVLTGAFEAGCSGDGYASRPYVTEVPRTPAARPAPRTAPATGGPTAKAPAATPSDAPAGALPVTVEDQRTFDEVNRMRAQGGLRALRWSDRLYRAARDHSAEQDRYGYMGHGSPDPARDDLGDRLRIAGYGPARQWAEVVAWGYEGPNSVVLGWMNSKGHRKILMDGGLEEAAFSRVGDYFTGDFGTPMQR